MATTSKYQIQVGVTGADQAAQKLGGVSRGLGSLAKQAAVAGAAYFSAAGIINGLKASIKLAGEQEQAERQLEKALGKSITGLKAYAAAQQQVTTFGDEVTLRAAAQFAQFTKNEEQIKQLLTATQDYAAAQGVDLVSAAQLVAKSFGSSTNALSRYGVEVTGAAGSTERLTSLTENMANMFSGQAAAATDTMAGRIEQMNNALGDAGEAVGSALAPAMVKLSELVKEAAEFWGELIDKMGGEKIYGSVKELADVNIAVAQTFAAAAKAGEQEAAALEKVGVRTASLMDLRKIAAELFKKSAELQRESSEAGWLEADQLKNSSEFYQDYASALLNLITQREQYAIAIERETAAQSEANTVQAVALKSIREPSLEIIRLQVASLQDLAAAERENIEAIQVTPTAMEEYNSAQLVKLEQMEREKELLDAFIAMYPEQAEALGLVTAAIGEQNAARDATVKGVGSLMGSFAQLNRVAAGNAALTKRLAQGEAIINTYSAANKALNNPPGPPWTIPAMLATVTMGLANVAQIEAQKFARGGDFVTSGPQMIMVGDNPGGRERVQITPISSPNIEGPRGGGVTSWPQMIMVGDNPGGRERVQITPTSSPNIEGPRGGGVTINFSGPVTDRDFVRDVIVPEVKRAARYA
jgi:hypothetical protein